MKLVQKPSYKHNFHFNFEGAKLLEHLVKRWVSHTTLTEKKRIKKNPVIPQ